jgi:RNA polymerase sigma-70 factor (ECF subfamily)
LAIAVGVAHTGVARPIIGCRAARDTGVMDMTRRPGDDLLGGAATVRPEPDVHLVTRAQRGDQVAFGELVNRHHSTVRRVAHAILRSPAETDDVMQEAWLHVYLHLPRFQGTASFRTWVHAIVRNRAIDHRRSAQRREWARTRLSAVSIPDELGSGARSPEALILDAERRERLTHAIAALPGRLREPLQLWHSGRHSYDEMARITGVTVGTIKSRVWEARQRVTQALSMAIAGVNEHVKGSL